MRRSKGLFRPRTAYNIFQLHMKTSRTNKVTLGAYLFPDQSVLKEESISHSCSNAITERAVNLADLGWPGTWRISVGIFFVSRTHTEMKEPNKKETGKMSHRIINIFNFYGISLSSCHFRPVMLSQDIFSWPLKGGWEWFYRWHNMGTQRKSNFSFS